MDSSKTLQAFLSYSHKDKNLAGEIKKNLENYNIEIFLAHEDIEPSSDWQEEIIHNLKSCDIFIPVLSKNFKESEWTDQESGIAFIENKKIIPLRVDLVPYGFIGKYQALKLDSENIADSCLNIIQIIIKTALKDRLIDCFIKSFVDIKHYADANEKAKLLEAFEPFTENQINEIVRGYIENNQISNGFTSGPIVRRMFQKYSELIKPEFKEKF